MKGVNVKDPLHRRRRAATLVETIVAIVIATAAIGLAAQTVALTATQQRMAEQQETATQQAANVMERLTAKAWSELDQQYADSLTLPPGCQSRLPNAELKVEIVLEEAADAPSAKRMRVEIAWQTRRDASPRAVDLTAWKFQPAEVAP